MKKLGLIHDSSQEARILRFLERRKGWVPAPELAAISLQYCARIAGLRRAGYDIENRLEIRDGVRHGFYRVKQQPQFVKPTVTTTPTTPPLFPDGVGKYPD